MAFAATTNTSFVATYGRSGQALSLFRSEPVQRIAAITSEQGTTTGENNKDKVTLSESSIEKSRQPDGSEHENSSPAAAASTEQQKTAATPARNTTQELTPTEEKVVQQLKVRDREVKTHEMAHLANAGQYARTVRTRALVSISGARLAAVARSAQARPSWPRRAPSPSARRQLQ